MSEMQPPYTPPPPPPPPPLPPPPPPPPADTLPWERPSAGLGSIVTTAGWFIGNPLRAFAAMSLKVDLVRPIAYYVAFVLLGTLFNQVWSLLFFESILEFVRKVAPPNVMDQMLPLMQRPGLIQVVLSLFITPLIMLIALFVWTALLHVGLVITGGAGGGFSATLRVVCYSRTTDIAQVVPFFGGLFGFVWRRVLEVMGLATAHKTDAWKAVVAVLLPLLLCCGCIAVGIFAFGAALSQALQQVK